MAHRVNKFQEEQSLCSPWPGAPVRRPRDVPGLGCVSAVWEAGSGDAHTAAGGPAVAAPAANPGGGEAQPQPQPQQGGYRVCPSEGGMADFGGFNLTAVAELCADPSLYVSGWIISDYKHTASSVVSWCKFGDTAFAF